MTCLFHIGENHEGECGKSKNGNQLQDFNRNRTQDLRIPGILGQGDLGKNQHDHQQFGRLINFRGNVRKPPGSESIHAP